MERSAVQSETAFWTWSSTLFMTVPSIVVDCYLGAWSDVLGRKFTLLMPPIGAIAGTAVYIAKGEKHFGYRVVTSGWESQCSATIG